MIPRAELTSTFTARSEDGREFTLHVFTNVFELSGDWTPVDGRFRRRRS
jgi:hypothetical protein